MSCIDRFGNEIRQLMDRYRAVLKSIAEVVRQTRIILEEDVYFAGLLYSNCEKYMYDGNEGFIGVCGNRLFEVVNISYETGPSYHPLHDALVKNYYWKLPLMTYTELPLLENGKTRIIMRIIYPGMGGGNVDVVVPRESLNDIARRFRIPTPAPAIDLDNEFVAIVFTIDGYRFAIKYTGREGRAYLEGGYPRGFENSPIACAITDAVVKIIEDALDLYEDIANKGLKFVSIYLLY
jgi:hypothetical protein